MEQNMTALVSLFARAYHQKSKDIKIFDDPLSTKLITKKEYEMIRLRVLFLDVIHVVACLMVIVMHAPVSGDRAVVIYVLLSCAHLLYDNILCIFYGKRSFVVAV